MRVLLINAPLTDLYTAYPGILYLSGHLRNKGYDVAVEDLSLQLGLKVFSKEGIRRISQELRGKYPATGDTPPKVAHFFKHEESYAHLVDVAVRHLQGLEPNLSYRIIKRGFYPPSPQEEVQWIYEKKTETRILASRGHHSGSEATDPLAVVFGRLGLHDRARYLSSVFLKDVIAIINQGLDPLLGIANYGVFINDPVHWQNQDLLNWRGRIEDEGIFCAKFMDELAIEAVEKHKPDLIGISAPFNHTAFAALRMARAMKQRCPAPIVLGGHYPTTSLRTMESPWIFKYVDYVVLDNGERPLECILEHFKGQRPKDRLLRTFFCEEQKVVYSSDPSEKDASQKAEGMPSYVGIEASQYLPVVYALSSMKMMFYGTFTNKMKLSHGCYWGRCTFCDTKLDYIGNYDPYSIDAVFDQMKRVMKETGSSAFHFVDEAMPPKLVKRLCQKIIDENLSITWWGYVRLDKGFTPELTRFMAKAGCVYVQAGVETPSERLLKLMNKGTDLRQIAQVSSNFAQAGIFVETCLMYGFPTQTAQDTVDGLEFIRQLFEHDCVHGAGWSRFYFSPHSPLADDPAKLGIEVDWAAADYDNWRFKHREANGIDHGAFERGLTASLENFSMKAGLDKDVRHWFKDKTLPATSLSPDFVAKILQGAEEGQKAAGVLGLGGELTP